MKKIVPYLMVLLLASFSPDKGKKISVPKQGSVGYYFGLKGKYKILSLETIKTAQGEIIAVKLSNLERDQIYLLKRSISEKDVLRDVTVVKIDTSVKININNGDQEVRLSFTYYNKWGGVIKSFIITVLFESGNKPEDKKRQKADGLLDYDLQILTSTRAMRGIFYKERISLLPQYHSREVLMPVTT